MPESRVLELRDRLMRNERYEDVLDWLAEECGVSSTLSSLSTFYKRHCAPLISERRQFAAAKSEAFGDAMAADPVNWDPKIIEKVKQFTFEFLDNPDADVKELTTLVDAIGRANQRQLDREKFEEALRKNDAARKDLEQKKAAGGLSDDAMELIERQLGMLS